MASGKPRILVTGGAGYIGSYTGLVLEQAGYDILILDNLICGHKDLVNSVLKAKLIVGDTGDRALLDNIFSAYNIIAVMHFAAFAYVGESVKNPAKYYHNNVTQTLTLLESMHRAGIKKFVFSSTCATYGVPKFLPITEQHPQEPINP